MGRHHFHKNAHVRLKKTHFEVDFIPVLIISRGNFQLQFFAIAWSNLVKTHSSPEARSLKLVDRHLG